MVTPSSCSRGHGLGRMGCGERLGLKKVSGQVGFPGDQDRGRDLNIHKGSWEAIP